MKGTCKSLDELEYFFEEVYKETTEKLDWNNPEGQQYPHDLRKPLPLIPNSRGRQVIPFAHFINNDLAYVVVSQSEPMQLPLRRPRLQIMVISNRLKRNLLVMSSTHVESLLSRSFRLSNGMVTNIWIGSSFLTNLNVEECLAFSVSLKIFTRSIVIQRRVEDLQLGVESYQKKLNITKPDT
ncbi:hypothetical protein Tco_0572878 [Tanacetum coccineum]